MTNDKYQIKSYEKRFGGNWLKTLKRDNFSCQVCKRDLKENRFAIHHKDGMGYHKKGLSANNFMDNLVSLCCRCHIRLHNFKFLKCKEESCNLRANVNGYCKKHYERVWFKEHYNNPEEKEKIKSYNEKYVERNRKKVNMWANNWRKNNKEKVKEMSRIYREKKRSLSLLCGEV